MESPTSQSENPSMRQGSWGRGPWTPVPLCNYHLFVSVGGPGVAVDLQDQFGKVDRDLRRAKISLNPPTEPAWSLF